MGGLSACASIPETHRELQAPSFRVVAIELEEESRTEGIATVFLEVVNPNDRRVAVDGIVFELVLNGTLIGKSVFGDDVFLSSLDDEVLDMPLRFGLDGATRTLVERTPERGVGYRVTGVAKVVGEGIPDRVPFRGEGIWHSPE